MAEPHKHRTMTRLGAIGLLNVAFGAMVSLGSLSELAAWLASSWVPELQRVLHALHDEAGITAWVVAQNAALFPLAVIFIVSGVRLWRHGLSAAPHTRRAAVAFIGISLVNQLVLSLTLYPRLLSGVSAAPDPLPHFWLISMVSAGVGLMFVPVLTLWLLRTGRGTRRAS